MTDVAQPQVEAMSQKRTAFGAGEFGNSITAPSNIMFDRRVVRGNTYAAQIIPPVRSLTSGNKGDMDGQ